MSFLLKILVFELFFKKFRFVFYKEYFHLSLTLFCADFFGSRLWKIWARRKLAEYHYRTVTLKVLDVYFGIRFQHACGPVSEWPPCDIRARACTARAFRARTWHTRQVFLTCLEFVYRFTRTYRPNIAQFIQEYRRSKIMSNREKSAWIFLLSSTDHR